MMLPHDRECVGALGVSAVPAHDPIAASGARGRPRRRGVAVCTAAVRRAVIAVGVPAASVAVAGTSLAGVAAGGHGSADPQALAAEAIRRLGLQTELPRGSEPSDLSLALSGLAFWVVVIAGLVLALGLLLYLVRDMIPIPRRGSRGAWADPEDRRTATGGSRAPELALGAADELAASGRFVDAMHVLLLQALAEIRRRLDDPFADSMTSREILRSLALSDELRRPLREVVDRVEWSYFGEHPAGREDYAACRGSFGALAQALHRTAA